MEIEEVKNVLKSNNIDVVDCYTGTGMFLGYKVDSTPGHRSLRSLQREAKRLLKEKSKWRG